MDFSRIIQMVINQLLRKAVNGGINVAMKQVSRIAKPAADVSPEQAQADALAHKRARQAAKLTRRL